MASLQNLLDQQTIDALKRRSSGGQARPTPEVGSQAQPRAVKPDRKDATKERKQRPGAKRRKTSKRAPGVTPSPSKAAKRPSSVRAPRSRRQLQLLRHEVLELKRVATLLGIAGARPELAKARRQMDALRRSLQELADASPKSTQLRSLLVEAGKLNRELTVIELLGPGDKLVHPLSRPAGSGAKKPPRPLRPTISGPAHTNYYQDPTNSK